MLILFQATVGQQLVQAPELQLARGPALAGFASLVVQGWLKSPWGVELSSRNSSSGPQVPVVREVPDTRICSVALSSWRAPIFAATYTIYTS